MENEQEYMKIPKESIKRMNPLESNGGKINLCWETIVTKNYTGLK